MKTIVRADAACNSYRSPPAALEGRAALHPSNVTDAIRGTLDEPAQPDLNVPGCEPNGAKNVAKGCPTRPRSGKVRKTLECGSRGRRASRS